MAVDLSEPIKYPKRAVAFIDVLGFSSTVLKSATDRAERMKITKLVQAFSSWPRFTETLTFAQGTFFSDSAVMSVVHPEHRFFYLIREVGMFARYLLHLGFSTRGGIAVGPLHHDGAVAVGPAMIEAYSIEKAVTFPRIALSGAAVQLWAQEFEDPPAHAQCQVWVKRDRDGVNFIDLFAPHWGNNIQMGEILDDVSTLPTTVDGFRALVQPHIATGCGLPDLKARTKWEWLRSQLVDSEA